MLQQTRMEVVLPRYRDFVRRFPSIAALAAATPDDVTAAWSGLGYYRRARMLQSGASAVMKQFGGMLPSTVAELMTIDGIGRYTAGAIASIAYDRTAPIVDGNIKRIVSRLFATHRDAWPHAIALVSEAKSPRVFNQALMEIGALICRPRAPRCEECPLRHECAARQRGSIARFPRRAKKVMTAATSMLQVITDRRGRVLLHRANLFVLPEGRRGRRIGSFKHTIMNRRITFFVYAATGKRRTANETWVAPRDLDHIPHPSYVRKALTLAGIIG